MRVTINITQEIIDKAARSFCCPIELTLEQIFRKGIYFHVSDSEVFLNIDEEKTSKTIQLPETAIDFIEIYDSDSKLCEPFSFELDIPEDWIKK